MNNESITPEDAEDCFADFMVERFFADSYDKIHGRIPIESFVGYRVGFGLGSRPGRYKCPVAYSLLTSSLHCCYCLN